MSYGYDLSTPVAYARPDERAAFVRRTYLHLAGAILAFVAVEAAIFSFFGTDNIMRFMMTYLQSGWSSLLIMGAFIGSGYLARSWAQSRTSMAMQYTGLGLYVLAQALIFVPILAVANAYPQFQGVIPMAGMLTLCLFGGLTTAALVTRKDFSFLAPIISIGGFLLLGVIVVSMIFPSFIGLGLWFSFLAVGLAAAAILYTTSNIIHHYSLDMHVAAALELFAAVAMLFFYILRILMQLRSR